MKSIDSFLKKITNKKLLVVFPHPDDESVMAGGIIQRAIKFGYDVTVLTLTEGDRGKIHIHGKGRSLSEIRRQEMAVCMSKLGVADWVMWKFDDGRLRRTHRWREGLCSFITDTRPGVVVSFDLSGVSGHPDHIVTSLAIRKTLKPIKNTKLLWVSFVGPMKKTLLNESVERYLQEPTHFLKLSFLESVTKWRSAFTHRSQNLKTFVRYPWWYLAVSQRTEWYFLPKADKKYRYKYVKFRI